MDFNRMSDEEKKVLEEVAKAKGQTLDEALEELGHAVQKEDETVSIEEPKAVVEEPVPIPVDPPDDDLTVKVEEPPAFEPPPAEEEEVQVAGETSSDMEKDFATIKAEVYQFEFEQIQQFAALVERTMDLSITITDGVFYIAANKGSCEVNLTTLQS